MLGVGSEPGQAVTLPAKLSENSQPNFGTPSRAIMTDLLDETQSHQDIA